MPRCDSPRSPNERKKCERHLFLISQGRGPGRGRLDQGSRPVRRAFPWSPQRGHHAVLQGEGATACRSAHRTEKQSQHAPRGESGGEPLEAREVNEEARRGVQLSRLPAHPDLVEACPEHVEGGEERLARNDRSPGRSGCSYFDRLSTSGSAAVRDHDDVRSGQEGTGGWSEAWRGTGSEAGAFAS